MGSHNSKPKRFLGKLKSRKKPKTRTIGVQSDFTDDESQVTNNADEQGSQDSSNGEEVHSASTETDSSDDEEAHALNTSRRSIIRGKGKGIGIDDGSSESSDRSGPSSYPPQPPEDFNHSRGIEEPEEVVNEEINYQYPQPYGYGPDQYNMSYDEQPTYYSNIPNQMSWGPPDYHPYNRENYYHHETTDHDLSWNNRYANNEVNNFFGPYSTGHDQPNYSERRDDRSWNDKYAQDVVESFFRWH